MKKFVCLCGDSFRTEAGLKRHKEKRVCGYWFVDEEEWKE